MCANSLERDALSTTLSAVGLILRAQGGPRAISTVLIMCVLAGWLPACLDGRPGITFRQSALLNFYASENSSLIRLRRWRCYGDKKPRIPFKVGRISAHAASYTITMLRESCTSWPLFVLKFPRKCK
jgi:hypothetical protein